MAMNFVGDAARLADRDLPRLGALIGVGEDVIHAVLDVEASGRGFDAKGRPKMLFEPHVFYRHLSGAKRDAAVKAGLAYAAWKPGAYPADSYPRLERAMAIDETAALKAASWGLGQILGENFRAAGYGSVQDMVIAFVHRGEAEHLAAMIRFIVASGLDGHLRRKDWAAFAKGYNGPQYAKHGYDKKLAAAYARWAKIPDTPFTPEPIKVVPPASPPRPVVLPEPTRMPSPGAVVIVPGPPPSSGGFLARLGAWWNRAT